MRSTLREHWPEYLSEGWSLGCFMAAIGMLVTLLESPRGPANAWMPSGTLRGVVLALGIGMTLALLIQSPWGKRSGAHLNPAVTVAFLRLGKISPWDALFYILAQTAGGLLGVLLVAFLMGRVFTDPPIRYAVTLPGPSGSAAAFVAEIVTSFTLMTTILVFTTSSYLRRFTALTIGCLVAFMIMVEAPLSGTSMNPARTLASAVPGMTWQHLWIYLLGPTLGMLIAAELHLHSRGRALGCAKLLHPRDVRCIHCGYRPATVDFGLPVECGQQRQGTIR